MSTEKEGHCTHCDQDVKPVEKRFWPGLFGWLTLLQFGAVIAAIVAAFRSYDPDAGGIGRLVLWPGAVHPAWVSILAALAAFITAVALSGAASRRAAANATCPQCGLQLQHGEPTPAT